MTESKMPASLPRCAALLRAVNVGGRKLRMAELRAELAAGGFEDVETLLASGNVVLRMPEETPAALEARLAEGIESAFEMSTEVLVRSHAELREVLERHPFAAEEPLGARLHVVFLRERPDPARVAAIDPDRSPPDRFAVIGREVYLHYPEGSGRSKLTLDWLERQLGTIGTGRNLNTVAKLVDLTDPGR